MARSGEKPRPSKAGSNWRKLQKVLAPEGPAAKKSRRSYDSTTSVKPVLDKGKGRAVELVRDEEHTNGISSRGSSSSPAPTTLPWFAEDLSPEDLALVRTNSETTLGHARRRGSNGTLPGLDDSIDGVAGSSEAEHRKHVILGGSGALSKEKMEAGTYVAIDCEMVGVGPNGSESVLARVSIVNWHGATLLDTFVRPQERVTDYRTWVSGVRPQDLQGAPAFSIVQQQVADLIKGRVLVGHAIHNDLSALLLSHPRPMIRDTATFQACRDLAKTKYPSLRKLVALKLGIDIQKRGQEHSSVEDARATMALYRTLHADWQKSLLASGKGAGPAAAGKSGKLKRPSSSSGGDGTILYPGWKGKRTVSSSSNGVTADSTARPQKAPRRSTQPDDPEWWSKV